MSLIKTAENLKAPVAKKIIKELILHDDKRIDNFFWMRLSDDQKNAEVPDSQTQDVLEYLHQENNYKERMMAPVKDLEENLYDEIIGRIKQTDMSVPYFDNGYIYSQKFEEGNEYPSISRRKAKESDEFLLLDINKLAEIYSYYQLRTYKVSPDNQLLAYSEDTVSRRQYTIRIKDISTNALLEDIIPNTEGSIVWSEDNQYIFYTVRDSSLRPYKVFRHKLGTSVNDDMEVFHETDAQFICYVYKTKSSKFIIIGSHANLSMEFRYISADQAESSFKIFHKRERKHEYHIDHLADKWYIISNKDGAYNFKLFESELDKTDANHWKERLAHRSDVLLEGLELFSNYMVIQERVKGLTNLRVIPENGEEYYIDFEEEAYMVFPTINKDIDSSKLRFNYTSLTTPMSTFDYDLKKKSKELLKQQEVVGSFNQNDYQSERILIPARDGVIVPLSIVYKKGFKKDGNSPLLLYAYGSYGHSIDPYFSSNRLSLLDRGFAFAIAHIRGGQELGRLWYEEGKLLKKKNTFFDFIDCAENLLENNYTCKEKLFAMGGSAGGLLMGAIINYRPELWGGVIAAVPFVDVVSTMLDDSIPLTTGEYDEWGNPNEEKQYQYIKSYSPYDNVEKKDYPPMLVTTGLHDSQVQYWEPAKWVAKMRELKTDDNPLLLHCNMETGHSGASGRFKVHRETAMEYAFLIDLAEVE